LKLTLVGQLEALMGHSILYTQSLHTRIHLLSLASQQLDRITQYLLFMEIHNCDAFSGESN